MKKFFLFLLLTLNAAFAQEARIIEAADGFLLRADGNLIADRSKFDSFKEENSQRVYSRKVKDKNGEEKVQKYYVHLDKNKNFHQVVSYDGLYDRSFVSTFKDGKIDTKTECYGSSCDTVSRNLCSSVSDYFKINGSVDFSKIQKKAQECENIFSGLYKKNIEPHLDGLAKAEESNLKWAGAALMEDSNWNAGKVFNLMWKDINRPSKILKEQYKELYVANSNFMLNIVDLIRSCSDFRDPVKSQAPKLKSDPQTKVTRQ